MRAPRSAPVAGTEAPGGTQTGVRLYRSLTDRKLFGVCGGLGAYLSVDSTILRLVFVASALASLGIMILLYLAAALIIPTEKPLPRPA
jgi:phage shock protein PspC (stress-responsive transcriptional regulator)